MSMALDYSYAHYINKLRGAQLIATIIQAVVLYLEAGRLGLISFLLPFFLVVCALYLVGTRWFQCVDGRYDFRQVLYVHDNATRLLYAIHFFGGFLLALAIHFMSSISFGLYSIAYNLASFLSIFSSFVGIGIEIFEAIRK